MKYLKNYLGKYAKQIFLCFGFVIFFCHCFYYRPPQFVEYQFQKSESLEDAEKPIVLMQKSIQSAVEGDKCEEKKKTHPCYEKCKRMYYWKGVDEKECQSALTVSQINILEETFDLLWAPDFEKLQSIHPDNLKAYLNISNSALSRIIRKYGSKEVEHFILWIISNEEITRIFEETDTNFKRLADLLYRVSPYTERTGYEPFIDNFDSKKLMEIAIQSENETVMELFFDFINHTNKYCSVEPVNRDCFNIYCNIGRAISKSARRDWRYVKNFNFYLSDIVNDKINSRQGKGVDKNSAGWIYKEKNGNEGLSEGDDVVDFVEDLCQGLGYSN